MSRKFIIDEEHLKALLEGARYYYALDLSVSSDWEGWSKIFGTIDELPTTDKSIEKGIANGSLVWYEENEVIQ